jgi:hypothetical protein
LEQTFKAFSHDKLNNLPIYLISVSGVPFCFVSLQSLPLFSPGEVWKLLLGNYEVSVPAVQAEVLHPYQLFPTLAVKRYIYATINAMANQHERDMEYSKLS